MLIYTSRIELIKGKSSNGEYYHVSFDLAECVYRQKLSKCGNTFRKQLEVAWCKIWE